MVTRLSRSESRARTRTELVLSAVRLFAKHGVADTSVEAVAEDAGYSRGAYHSNFSSRKELLDAVVAHVVAGLAPRLAATLEDAPDASTGLRRYIGQFLEFCEQHPVETRALVAVASHNAVTTPGSYDETVNSSLADLVKLFEEGQAAGTMRSFDTAMMAGLLRRALDAEALRVAGGGVPAAFVSAELAETFVRATRADTAVG